MNVSFTVIIKLILKQKKLQTKYDDLKHKGYLVIILIGLIVIQVALENDIEIQYKYGKKIGNRQWRTN